MSTLNSIKPNRYKSIYIAAVVVMKVAFFLFYTIEFQKNRSDKLEGRLFVHNGETSTYYLPLENLFQGKGYSYDQIDRKSGNFKLQPSTRRLPGLAVFYLPLRLFLSPINTKQVIIILQFLLSLISIIILGQIAEKLTDNRLAFYLCTGIFALSSFSAVYDHFGLTESLSISTSIFGLYFFFKATKNSHRDNLCLILCSVFIALSIFLRPAVGILLACFIIAIISAGKLGIPLFKKVFLLSSVVGISLSIWTIRNYTETNRLVVLEDSVFDVMPHIYTPAEKALRPLINRWGGQRKKFYPNTMGAFFYKKNDDVSIFPSQIFSDTFNVDSLFAFRDLFLDAHKNYVKVELSEKFVKQSDELRNAYKTSFPISYYIIAPIKSFLRFVFIKTENQLPFPERSEMSLLQKAIKGGNIILYNLIALLYFVFLSIHLLRKEYGRWTPIYIFPLLYCFALACVLYNTEVRYLASVWPFMILTAIVLISQKIVWRFPEFNKQINEDG